MGAPAKLLLVGIVFAVGFSVGGNSKPDTEIVTKTVHEYIEVPTVKVEKQTEIKTVTVPMPAVCTEAIALLQTLKPYDSQMSQAAGEIKDLTDQAQQQIVMKEVLELNKTIPKMTQSQSDLGNASINKRVAITRLDTLMTQCVADTKK